jgi:uncharacterized protein YqgC (DUF456 family)
VARPNILFPLIPALLLVAAGALALRFMRSRGMERQQLKWLAYAAGLNLVVGLLPAAVPGIQPTRRAPMAPSAAVPGRRVAATGGCP